MKNVYYTLSVVCLLLVFSCKKDKDDVKTQIVGRWKIESLSYKVFVDNQEIKSESETEAGSADDYIEFTADGKISTRSGGQNESTTYTLDETNRTLTADGQTYSISELTKTRLVLKSSETEVYNGKTARLETTLSLNK